jgi:ketosteroid isomerase-like protein
LPYFPSSFQMETRDLSIIVNGDLALAHWLWRFTGMETDHPETSQAAFTLEP